MYGSGYLLNHVITKGRPMVSSHYMVPGALKMGAVAERAIWLLQKSVFRHGNLDIEVSILYNCMFIT